MIKSAIVAALAALAKTPALACSSWGCALTSDWLAQGLVTQPGTTLTLRYDDVPQTRLQSGRHGVDPASIVLPSDREVEHYTYNHYVTATLDHQFAGTGGLDLPTAIRERTPTVTTAAANCFTSLPAARSGCRRGRRFSPTFRYRSISASSGSS
jgi:hypothetical protein